MKTYLDPTGPVPMMFVILITGIVLSLLLYIGIMPDEIVVKYDNMGSKEITGPLQSLVYDNGWFKPVSMFLAMLAGMFFNQLFENLKVQKEAGKTQANLFRLFADGLTGITFWMAFFVSPVIFYGTYYLVDKLPDGVVGYFYAFQGGFFWYNIFNRFELKSKK
jgi:hypothetical protein